MTPTVLPKSFFMLVLMRFTTMEARLAHKVVEGVFVPDLDLQCQFERRHRRPPSQPVLFRSSGAASSHNEIAMRPIRPCCVVLIFRVTRVRCRARQCLYETLSEIFSPSPRVKHELLQTHTDVLLQFSFLRLSVESPPHPLLTV